MADQPPQFAKRLPTDKAVVGIGAGTMGDTVHRRNGQGWAGPDRIQRYSAV